MPFLPTEIFQRFFPPAQINLNRNLNHDKVLHCCFHAIHIFDKKRGTSQKVEREFIPPTFDLGSCAQFEYLQMAFSSNTEKYDVKHYFVSSQDPSDIGSGNFVPSSGLGLTDVSNLLETEVDKIKQKLAMAEINLQQAQNQASYLESLAHQMEQ